MSDQLLKQFKEYQKKKITKSSFAKYAGPVTNLKICFGKYHPVYPKNPSIPFYVTP